MYHGRYMPPCVYKCVPRWVYAPCVYNPGIPWWVCLPACLREVPWWVGLPVCLRAGVRVNVSYAGYVRAGVRVNVSYAGYWAQRGLSSLSVSLLVDTRTMLFFINFNVRKVREWAQERDLSLSRFTVGRHFRTCRIINFVTEMRGLGGPERGGGPPVSLVGTVHMVAIPAHLSTFCSKPTIIR